MFFYVFEAHVGQSVLSGIILTGIFDGLERCSIRIFPKPFLTGFLCIFKGLQHFLPYMAEFIQIHYGKSFKLITPLGTAL